MKKTLKNLIIVVGLILMVVQPALPLLQKLNLPTRVKAEDATTVDDSDVYSSPDEMVEDDSGSIDTTDEVEPTDLGSETIDNPNTADGSLLTLNSFVSNSYQNDTKNTDETGFLDAIAASKEQKLVFNTSDLQDLRTMYCLGNTIPDFDNDIDSLSTASGVSIESLKKMKIDDQTGYQKLITSAKSAAKANVVSNLKSDLKNFACIAGVNETKAADMLKNDSEGVTRVIGYATEDIVIDKRVLDMLLYLVTPKDEGGAGHDRIKVYRLRKNYNRDAKMYSRESDTAYQDIANKESGTTSTDDTTTISDVSSTSNSDLSSNATYANAEAVGQLQDSNGADQGDLVFNDVGEDKNVSAHYSGQAVDISEIDSIKCTLVKKKRIGSDSKTAQPAVPIKIAWQTSAGLDSDNSVTSSSLNSSLKSLMSSSFADLLDEFNVSNDEDSNFSNPQISDIIDYIGQSLISEVLNSSGNTISGFSFSDTMKRVGGLILADTLDLPRQAFVNGQYTSIDQLKLAVGEATLEKKLGLPYGSIKGDSLSEIATNIGLRKVETELDIPEGTLTADLKSQSEMRIAIGRKVIEDKLSLESGVFTADTNYSKLKEKAGSRKVDLLFANSSQVDQRLEIDLGESEKYKNGTYSPDDFANFVGAKKLADTAYSYEYTTATVNASNLTAYANDKDRTQSATMMNQILNGSDKSTLTTNYQQIGISEIAKIMSSNSDTQKAITTWIGSAISNTNCSMQNAMKIDVTNEKGKTVSVTISETEFMSKTGLNKGDFFRLFGCETSGRQSVLSRFGEKTLVAAVKDSSLAESAENSMLASHPEISSLIADYDFYNTRFENIKTLSAKIKSDWESFKSEDTELAIAVIELSGNIQNTFSSISLNGTDFTPITTAAKAVVSSADKINSVLNTKTTDNQTLRDHINSSLSDVTNLARNFDEILSGEESSNISDLTVGSVSLTSNTGSSSEDKAIVDRGSLILMLAGKLSPEDFFVSIGSRQVEENLDLPINAINYFAKYTSDSSRDKNQDKNKFFWSIGQAQIEETFNMPSGFFQGKSFGDDATITDIRDHIADTYKISTAEAGVKLMRALGLNSDISNISAGSGFSSAALSIDNKLYLASGTTAKFLTGETVVSSGDISATDSRMFTGYLGIAESALQKISNIKLGVTSLSDARADTSDDVSYTTHNEFAKTAKSETASICPVEYQSKDGFTIASGLMPDNSYNIVDTEGVKSFASYNEAKNYVDANADKKLDFVDNIAAGVAKGSGNSISQDSAKKKIESFLSNSNAKTAFNDTELKAIADNSGIPIDSVTSLFSRGTGGPSSSYKYEVGVKTAERRIANALFDGLGLTVAGLEIDATDIYDIFSGNGKQAIYAIGSRYIEQELNISYGSLQKLIEAPTIDTKKCSLSDIGGSILGSYIGIKGLSLEGNIFDNIGASMIEENLGLPAKTFHGANLTELVNNVGPLKFAESFNLPMSGVIDDATYTKLFGSKAAATVKQLTSSQQMSRINSVLQNPSTINDKTVDVTTISAEINQKIQNQIANYSNVNNWQYQNDAKDKTAIELNRFIDQAKSADSKLGMEFGTTQKLLTNQITPTEYRTLAANGALNNMAKVKLADMLGFDANDSTINSVLNGFVTNVRAGNYQAAISDTTSLLGYKFDAQLGVEKGTIQKVLADPSKGPAVALEMAVKNLDLQFDLDSATEDSFSYLYKSYYAGENTEKDYAKCATGQESCFTRSSGPTGAKVENFQVKDLTFTGTATRIANKLIKRYKASPYLLAITESDTPLEDITSLFNGDMTFLAMATAIETTKALNVYGEDSTLPSQYRITYADIAYAFKGDTEITNGYADRAEASTVSAIDDPASYNAANYGVLDAAADLSSTLDAYTYGSQCPAGVTGKKDCYNPDDPTAFTYSTAENLAAYKTQFDATNPVNQKYIDDPKLVKDKYNTLTVAAQENINTEKESAMIKAEEDMKKILAYRLADAQLYQKDPNIPLGFTQTLLTGNGVAKTQMLNSYLKNSLKNGKLFGVELPIAVDLDFANDILALYNDPAGFDLDTFVKNGNMEKLDSYLTDKFDSVLGISFSKGTFSAIIAGVKTGNFNTDVTFSGVKVQSLSTLYNNWATEKITNFADNALGLPAGSAYQAYTMYNKLRAAEAQLSIAKNAASLADMPAGITSVADAQDAVATNKAELISFAINIVFSAQIAKAEESLGLVPGTGAMAVSILVSLLTPNAAVSPQLVVVFVLMNLFGVYKTELLCTADGYYPQIESEPDANKYDSPNLGVFNGMSQSAVKENYTKAAQYKAQTLMGDVYAFAERTDNDESYVPSQVITGRQEDVDYWNYKVNELVCSKFGTCEGTRAGAWVNSDIVGYTHIGF